MCKTAAVWEHGTAYYGGVSIERRMQTTIVSLNKNRVSFLYEPISLFSIYRMKLAYNSEKVL